MDLPKVMSYLLENHQFRNKLFNSGSFHHLQWFLLSASVNWNACTWQRNLLVFNLWNDGLRECRENKMLAIKDCLQYMYLVCALECVQFNLELWLRTLIMIFLKHIFLCWNTSIGIGGHKRARFLHGFKGMFVFCKVFVLLIEWCGTCICVGFAWLCGIGLNGVCKSYATIICIEILEMSQHKQILCSPWLESSRNYAPIHIP